MTGDVPAWMRWALLGVRPLAAGASRIDRLRFARNLQVRVALLLAPCESLLVALAPPTWVLAVALGGFGLLVIDAVYLTTKIRHAESHYR